MRDSTGNNEQDFNQSPVKDTPIGQEVTGGGDAVKADKDGQAVSGGGDAVKADKGGQAAKAGRDATNIKTDVNAPVKGDINFAKEIIKNIQNNTEVINYFQGEDQKVEIEKFSISDTTPIKNEEIQRVKEVFVYPDDKKKDLISYLSHERILLLKGKAETGKFCTAKYLAYSMMQEKRKDYNVLLVDPLERKSTIELRKLVENSTDLKQVILIFIDVFARKNQNLMDFFSYYSREKIEEISRKLEKADAFILFTADLKTFDTNLLSNIDIAREIAPLDQKLLQKGFELTLKQVCSGENKRDFEKASKLFENKIVEVIDKLKFSRMPSFFEDYLDKILSGEKSIDEALELFLDTRKTLERWYLIELGEKKEEFEAWTFTLCMALFNQSSYTFFTDIHRKITVKLLPLFNSINSRQEFAFIRSESKLLEKASVKISKNSLVDIIEFRDSGNQGDSEYQEVLISILLEHSRKALLSLIPILEEYIEGQYWSHDQRIILAAGLARIGWIDPQHIIDPLINRWAKKDDVYHKINVGYLYKGIITHGDESYQKYCLTQLKDMAISGDYDAQLTAIAAYTEIGYHKLEFAMEELRNIHEVVIKRMSKEEEECMLGYLFALDSFLDEKKSEENFADELAMIYKNTLYLLSNIPYSLVAWAIRVNVMDIFEGLRKWIDKGKATSRSIIVLFVMGSEYDDFEFEGVFQLLKGWEISYSNETEEGKEEEILCSPVLYELAAGEEQVKKMAAFLKDLYKKCFSTSDMNKSYKRLLFKHLEEWTLDSLSNSKLKNAMEKLIVQFYNVGDDELKDTLWDNINRWKAPGKKEKELEAFIDKVSKRIFNM